MTRSTRDRRRHADRTRTRPRLEGLEGRCLLSITEYPVPTANAAPAYLTTGPDGNIWFTEYNDSNVGVLNTATGAITEYPVQAVSAGLRGITVGPDGNIWFTEFAGKVGMVNPTTKVITQYPVQDTAGGVQAITQGPDGNLWYNEYWANDNGVSRIGMFNPTTHASADFPVTAPSKNGAFLSGLTTGPDGNLWFTEYFAGSKTLPAVSKVGMINPTTHAFSAFSTPTAGSDPLEITAGPDGNLWFTEKDANKIGRINPQTDVITEFPVPTPAAGLSGITAGPDGNLWFTEYFAGKIGMINPTTYSIVEYPIPYPGANPRRITVDSAGNYWFTDQSLDAIGALYQQNLVVTTQPPSSATAGGSFGLTVQAEDSSGNLITSFNGPVTLALASNPGGATLGGTLTVTAAGGVATFSGLTLDKAASGYALAATAVGLGRGVTGAMTVIPSSPAQLVFTQPPPATVKVGTAFALKAAIADLYGNVVTTASGTVSVGFASNPTGATLGGTPTVAVSQGVASFTNLTINKVGSGYALGASSSGLTSATSGPINVTSSGKAASTLTASPAAGATATDLAPAPLVFDGPDPWDGVRPKKRVRPVG